MCGREKKNANELHGRKQHHYSAQMAIFATCPRLYIEKNVSTMSIHGDTMVRSWRLARCLPVIFFFQTKLLRYFSLLNEFYGSFQVARADDVHFLSGSELSIVKGYLSRYNVIKRTEKRCLRFYGVNGVDLLDPGVAEIGSKNNALRFVMM